MSMGIGFWLDECEKMSPAILNKLERMVAREYMSRALRALTLGEMKKLITHIRKVRKNAQK